ncbi:MAG: N-acyl-D-amino-acid deacylase family protein [Chloroflexota bacterium]
MLDILIRNGWVADGTGNPLYPADVGIQGDRIVEVGRLEGAEAARVIDATGKIVSPGFIDAHSHTDSTIQVNPTAESTVRQGTTTEIVGNCGGSMAPLTEASRERTTARLRKYGYQDAIDWAGFGEYLEAVRRMGTSINLAYFVGHNALRAAAAVSGPRATEEQLRAMEAMVEEAMEAGALGMSTGLEFEPGRQAPAEEVIRLAKVVGRYDGYYASHIRNRDARLLEAVEEFLEIERASGTRGEISHLNTRHNTGVPEGGWQRAADTVEQARRGGLNVLADMTPFAFGTGSMASILPPWVREGGPTRAAELLRDPSVRARLRTECDRYWRFIHRGEWHRVRLLSSAEYPELCSKSFPEIAEIMGKDPWECYFDILAAAGPKLDSLGLVAILFTEEHLRETISHPLFMLGVDGVSSRIDGALAEQTRTPIHFCGMTHYLTYHVREKHTLSLEEAIRKMTSMPASHFGLRDRGLLRANCFADVAVFDFERLEDVSTLEQPVAYVRGVEQVLVNGVLVVDGGNHTGARPGRNLLRS